MRDPGLVASVFFAHRDVDILVCCHGVYGPIGDTAQVSWSEWQDCIATNLYGSVLCCREAVIKMRQRKGGKIVLIAGGGQGAFPGRAAYAASKTALVRFAETLAHEVAADNISVNSVAPGRLWTAMTAHEEYTHYDDIQQAAECVAFLCSPESDGITGRLISAVWDDWRNVKPKHDQWTLRRFV